MSRMQVLESSLSFIILVLTFCDAFLSQTLTTRLFLEKEKGMGLSAVCHLGRVEWLAASAEGSGEAKGSSAASAFPAPLLSFENNLYRLSKLMKGEGDEGV